MVASVSIAVVACGPGNNTPPVAVTGPVAPAATTTTQTVTLPAPPTGTNTVQATLPSAGGITPTLVLGAGYPAGTQLLVSASNYGQTASVERRAAATTFATCPVLLDVTAYATQAIPASALVAISVNYSVLNFVGTGTFSISIYDAGAAPASGPPPAPPATNGCPSAPANSSVLGTGTGTVSNGTVTFNNITSNSGLSSTLQTLYKVSGGSPTIPANEVFGFYVTFVPGATPSPAPTSSGSASPSPTPTGTGSTNASPTPSPSASATATASASPTAQASASATASASTLTAGGASFSLPSLNNGAYSGTVPYGPVTGSTTGPYTIAFANYHGAPSPAPTVPAGVTVVYAEINIINSGTGSPAFGGTPSNITLTVPTTAGKSSVTVRMWEMNGLPGGTPVCLGNNVTTLTVTPGAGGTLSFLTPFQASTGTTGSNCTDNQLNPFGFGTAGSDSAFIMITDR